MVSVRIPLVSALAFASALVEILVPTISLKPVDGIPLILPGYIIGTSLRADQVLVALKSLSLEPVNGIPPNLPGYINGTSFKADKVLVTLTSFLRIRTYINMSNYNKPKR